MTYDPQSPPKHRCFKALALLLFVFLLGNLTGIGGSAFVILKRLQSTLRDPSVANAPVNHFLDRAESKISGDLKLTEDERKAVHGELQITGTRLGEIRSEMAGQLKTLARETVDRVEQKIPEAKRAAFRESATEHLEPWGVLK